MGCCTKLSGSFFRLQLEPSPSLQHREAFSVLHVVSLLMMEIPDPGLVSLSQRLLQFVLNPDPGDAPTPTPCVNPMVWKVCTEYSGPQCHSRWPSIGSPRSPPSAVPPRL